MLHCHCVMYVSADGTDCWENAGWSKWCTCQDRQEFHVKNSFSFYRWVADVLKLFFCLRMYFKNYVSSSLNCGYGCVMIHMDHKIWSVAWSFQKDVIIMLQYSLHSLVHVIACCTYACDVFEICPTAQPIMGMRICSRTSNTTPVCVRAFVGMVWWQWFTLLFVLRLAMSYTGKPRDV